MTKKQLLKRLKEYGEQESGEVCLLLWDDGSGRIVRLTYAEGNTISRFFYNKDVIVLTEFNKDLKEVK